MKTKQENFDFLSAMLKICPTCHQEVTEDFRDPRMVEVKSVREIILFWKYISGVPLEDKAWNKVFFPRFFRTAKTLLTLFTTVDDVQDCIEYVFKDCQSKKLSCTLETVLKRSDTFREVMHRRKT